jgi:hypothetical protein
VVAGDVGGYEVAEAVAVEIGHGDGVRGIARREKVLAGTVSLIRTSRVFGKDR